MCVWFPPLGPLVLFNVHWTSGTLLIMPFLLLQVLCRCQDKNLLFCRMLYCAAVGSREGENFAAVLCSIEKKTEMQSLSAHCFSFPFQYFVNKFVILYKDNWTQWNSLFIAKRSKLYQHIKYYSLSYCDFYICSSGFSRLSVYKVLKEIWPFI